MGDASNRFHLELVRPATETLLRVKSGERVLDIGCGNGRFSRRLCELGARVVAFDFSAQLIERARARSQGLDIAYHVLDATDARAMLALGPGTFHAAVSNMALMDMSQVNPLIRSVHQLLVPGGRFVLSLMHPCFQAPGLVKVVEEEDQGGRVVARSMIKLVRYKDPESFQGLALSEQATPQLYFHRPLGLLMGALFEHGFVLNGLQEPVFAAGSPGRFEWTEIPPVMVLRFTRT